MVPIESFRVHNVSFHVGVRRAPTFLLLGRPIPRVIDRVCDGVRRMRLAPAFALPRRVKDVTSARLPASGRRPATRRFPASLRTSRHFHMAAFATVLLTHGGVPPCLTAFLS
jgi:hypothetical protein